MRIVDGPWDTMSALVKPLRLCVFVHEQQVPETLEWDDDDAGAVHIACLSNTGALAGCARLLPDGHLGRMAVDAGYRRRGIGSALLAHAEAIARLAGHQRIILHAQTHAIPFYERHAYTCVSEEFIDAGIPHRTMEKTLTVTS